MTAGDASTSTPRGPPTFREALRFWVKLGFINFGGPAGQIAIMHSELVERRRWIREREFLRALNFTMVLPGPEAQQLATYVGWRLHGVPGGLVAGAFFIIPSVFVLLFLSWLAVVHGDVPVVSGILYGVQPMVIAIVVEAVMRVGKRTLHHGVLFGFAVAAFVALYFLSVPFPAVIALAALAGLLLQRVVPRAFDPRGHASPDLPGADASPRDAARPSLARLARTLGVFAVLWAVPVLGVVAWRGTGDVLAQEALFFTKAAFVTFGGAYAVLSYIADVAVNQYGWMAAGQMVQGLALAESTPGPLIMVTQYVGFVGAYNLAPAGVDPVAYGIAGALVTTYVTFLPSFMFILVGGPYVEALAGNARVQAALVGVTSAVVGVIANLAVFFGTRVLIPGYPDALAVDGIAVALTALAFVLLLRFRMPLHHLVLVGGAAGAGLALAGLV